MTDQLQIFRSLLTDLRTFRLEAKASMRAATDRAQQQYFHALQNTFKILINSFYGYLGFAQGHFADFDAAARVTQIGRDLLQKMIDWLSKRGAQVIEVDTDGIYFVPPPNAESEQLRSELAKELPPGIEVEFDEQFDAMFSYKAKNYALLTRDGEVIIKGGALKSRGLEKFQRVFLEEIIKLLMLEKPEAIPALRADFETKDPRTRVADRDVDENRHAPGFARKISRKDRRLRAQPRRRLRTRPRQRPRLSDRATRSATTSKARRRTSPPTKPPSWRATSTRKTATRTSITTSPNSAELMKKFGDVTTAPTPPATQETLAL